MTTSTLSTKVTFGQVLRLWRRSQRLSQREFGELLHPKANHSTVSCWESGARRPSLFFLAQIIAITGIPAFLALDVDLAGPGAGRR